MVDLALKNLPEGRFFSAICETPACLPDFVKLLTTCTIRNGWLTVLDFGRFAVTLYERTSGNGVRMYLDMNKLEKWSEVQGWFLKPKTDKDQDFALLMDQIREAGHAMLSVQHVCIEPERLQRKRMSPVVTCPACGEAYSVRDGDRCRSCSGESPYKAIKPNKPKTQFADVVDRQ